MEELDGEIESRADHELYDEYRVVHSLIYEKIHELKTPKGEVTVGIPQEAFDLAQEAVQKSIDLLKVWEWGYNDYVEYSKKEGYEPSEDEYYDLMQAYTDDFIEEEFDEDLKNAMSDAREWEWRDEHEFRRKMNQYLKDISSYELSYKEIFRDEAKLLLREVFSDE
jgi:replication fork clamp-binding protein CrfC